MSSAESSDSSVNRTPYREPDETPSPNSLASHLESLLDQAMLSTAQRDELIGKLRDQVRVDANARMESKEQVLSLVNVTLAHEFQLSEPIPRIWSRTAENVASTLWNHDESRSRLERLWQQLKDTT